jgi:hypothetical protein
MSALPHFADSSWTSPGRLRSAKTGPEQSQQNSNLLDHLVGAAKWWERNGETKRRLGDLEVDDQLNFRSVLARTLKVSSDAKATTSVVSDVLLPHELRLVQRGHRQRGRRQVHLLRRW